MASNPSRIKILYSAIVKANIVKLSKKIANITHRKTPKYIKVPIKRERHFKLSYEYFRCLKWDYAGIWLRITWENLNMLFSKIFCGILNRN